jgi:hypothetical protein
MPPPAEASAFNPVLNDRGDLVFLGDLTPPANASHATLTDGRGVLLLATPKP